MDIPATEAIICPKCQAPMRSYERSGIVIDQCTECRGIYLDRGELQRLFEAEAVADRGPASSAERADDDRDHKDEGGSSGRGGSGHGGSGHGSGQGGSSGSGKRRGSFLTDLLDFG